MINRKVGIVLTTFLRDELLYKSVESIINNWNNNYHLLVGDQGHHSNEKEI